MQQVPKHRVVRHYKRLIDKTLPTYSMLRHFRNESNACLENNYATHKRTNTKYDFYMSLSNFYCCGNIYCVSQHIRSISYDASESKSSNSFSDEETDNLMANVEAASLRNKPYGYYDILGIPKGNAKKSKMSDIKDAYFRLAKRYHPDAYPDKDNPESRRKARIARFKFDEITEAYQTLMDLNQRYFYDKHGYAPEALRKQGIPNIFEYVPKYGIYEEQILSDNETTGLEDWFKSQGHSVRDPNITIRQMIKNAYIEFRWGLAYHNFPWKLKEFFQYIVAVCITCVGLGWCYGKYIRYRSNLLPEGHPHKPIKINNKWENDEQRDILQFYGLRKTRPTEKLRQGFYHRPLTSTEGEKRKQNMLDGKLFSEGQYESWKSSSSKEYNIERHRAWIKEEKERKINITKEKREYWETRIASVISEIEKFKLDEYILKNAENRNKSKSSTKFMLSNEEFEALKKKHTATNMVALNSKLNAAKNELEEVLGELKSLNAPVTERIEDQYILPPSPGSKDFKVTVGEANLSILDRENDDVLKKRTHTSDPSISNGLKLPNLPNIAS